MIGQCHWANGSRWFTVVHFLGGGFLVVPTRSPTLPLRLLATPLTDVEMARMQDGARECLAEEFRDALQMRAADGASVLGARTKKTVARLTIGHSPERAIERPKSAKSQEQAGHTSTACLSFPSQGKMSTLQGRFSGEGSGEAPAILFGVRTHQGTIETRKRKDTRTNPPFRPTSTLRPKLPTRTRVLREWRVASVSWSNGVNLRSTCAKRKVCRTSR